MRELIALNVVILAGFVLGSFFGAGVYHAIQRLAQKGKAEELMAAAKAYSEKILAEAYKKAGAIEHDVKDGLPHA